MLFGVLLLVSGVSPLGADISLNGAHTDHLLVEKD